MQTFVEERKEEGRLEEVYLTDYLQDVALLTDLDSKGDDDEPRVSLMTVHAAKGLEFVTVFVVGLEENIFPSPISAASLRELEEERRLLYVAITRAEKHCILTNAKNRFRYGKMEFDNPSRFIAELDPDLLEGDESSALDSSDYGSSYGSRSRGERYGGYGGRMPWDNDESRSRRRTSWSDDEDLPEWAKPQRRSPKPVASQFMADPKPLDGMFKPVRAVNAARRIMGENSSEPTASSSMAGLHEGTKIEHQRFGIGTVLKVEGTGENAKATVDFANSGRKRLLLKFAKFTVIE